ncbi:MAG: hypothetical protein ACLGG4_06855 [Gammaproteobacteria bacterium]
MPGTAVSGAMKQAWDESRSFMPKRQRFGRAPVRVDRRGGAPDDGAAGGQGAKRLDMAGYCSVRQGQQAACHERAAGPGTMGPSE